VNINANIKNKNLEKKGNIVDPKQSDKIYKTHNQEISKELKQLNRKRHVAKADIKEIEELYQDRSILAQNAFTDKGGKSDGITGGYEATDKNGNVFLLKNFFKSAKHCKTRYDSLERKDAINEFVIAGIYRYIMPDRAPREHLVQGDELGEFKIKQIGSEGKLLRNDTVPTKDMLFVRSKFFQDAKPMADLPAAEISKGKGFAKTVAGCIIGGEADYHRGNLMFSGKDNNFLKIDHGRSFEERYEDFSSFIKATNINFNHFGYNHNITELSLKFDATEFKDSLKQMVSSLNAEQVDNMVDQRLAELKKEGLDPRGITLDYRFNNVASQWQERTTNSRDKEFWMDRNSIAIPTNLSVEDSYEQLGLHYKHFLNSSLASTKEIVANLEIIDKFSKSPKGFDLKKFKEGGWLEQTANFKCDIKDPVLFAAHNNIMIEDKNPLIWARDNNYKIKQYKFDSREGKVVVAAALFPSNYILKYKGDTNQKLSETEKEFLSEPLVERRFQPKHARSDTKKSPPTKNNKSLFAAVKKGFRAIFMHNKEATRANKPRKPAADQRTARGRGL
jgi:hypothetical protein